MFAVCCIPDKKLDRTLLLSPKKSKLDPAKSLFSPPKRMPLTDQTLSFIFKAFGGGVPTPEFIGAIFRGKGEFLLTPKLKSPPPFSLPPSP